MPKRDSPLPAVFFAALSVALVLGSAYAALHENRIRQAEAPTAPPPTFPAPVLLTPGQPTPSPPAPSATPQPPASCLPPAGWVAVTVQTGETLEGLAQQYQTSAQALAEANCLRSERVPAGALLYVPVAAPTPPAAQCGPPPGWVFYTVQPGENLFRIGLAFGVNVTTLQAANCMGASTSIRAGQRLYVPNVPTRTVQPATATPTETFTATPSATAPPAASSTATFTPTPSATPTLPSATPTDTPATPAGATSTPTPAAATPTPTSAPSATPTAPAATPTPGTPTGTPASTPTWTPTPSPTPFLLPTATPTP